ncbi:MAG TPA: phosphoserine phosphatase SerB [Terracidiphilus sp.]
MPTASPEAILIHFSGHDAPGQTAALTGILARHNVHILDIGQAVVHESLTLGILVESPGEPFATVKADLTASAHALGLQTRFRAIPRNALQHWAQGLQQHHFIITVLGRSITARELARVSGIIARHQMTIVRIDRLSGKLAPADPGDDLAGDACVEFAVCGDAANEIAMRAEFLQAAQELSIDVAFQRESIFRRNRRLFAFDMDSTLIQGEVIDELARMAGVGDQVVQITEAAMRGELNFDESFTRRVGLLKGLPAQRALSLLNTIPLAQGAERLVRTLKLLGYKTAILSGGFTFFAHDLQRRLAIDYVYANELEIENGAVTGRVRPPIMNGARKAEKLAEIARAEGFSLEQCVAVGDGANDIPMLNLAGMGIAYRAKPLVRQKAGQSISTLGLDGLLYLIGVREWDLDQHEPVVSGIPA